jgi:hypothetical protein
MENGALRVYTKRAFSRAISRNLELFGGPFLAASGFVSVGVGHLS